MKAFQTFTRSAIADMRSGDESWRVRALVALYAIGGAAINLIILKVLESS